MAQDLRLRRLRRDEQASNEGNGGIVRGLGERESLTQREESLAQREDSLAQREVSPTRREGVLDVITSGSNERLRIVEIKGHQLLRSSTEGR